MQCALAFDSLEQLGQCAAATALLFNPMGEVLEIRTWLVLVAFHTTISMGVRTVTRLPQRTKMSLLNVSDGYFS